MKAEQVVETKDKLLFFGPPIARRKNDLWLWPSLFLQFLCMSIFKFFLCLFFGFQIDCDEEGTRIVKCSIKMTKKDNKKVLSSSTLLLWSPTCHCLCHYCASHHCCTIRRNMRKMNPHNNNNNNNTRRRECNDMW